MSEGQIIGHVGPEESQEARQRRLFVASQYIKKGLYILTKGKDVNLGRITGEIPEDGSVGELFLEVSFRSEMDDVQREENSQEMEEEEVRLIRQFWCSVCGYKMKVEDPSLVVKYSFMHQCPNCCRPDSQVRFYQGKRIR